MIRLVLRKEKLDAVYGYANAEDNDTISIKTSEVEIITFEPNDKGNKGTNEKLR